MAAALAFARSRSGVPAALVVATLGLGLLYSYSLTPLPRMAVGALYLAVPPLQGPLVRLDLALSRASREEVIRLAASGSLPASERYGGYVMPTDAAGLSVYGNVDVADSACGQRFFFMTLTGFSPDPYAGFEFVPTGCEPEVDPLGSGSGVAEPLGDGWFWIEAS
jgi:hypothetical protein